MGANQTYLCELDGAMGDGDLGLTMAEGFRQVAYMLTASLETDVGKLLQLAGITLSQVVPSTMGTLLATALLRAGREAKGLSAVELPDVIRLARAAIAGIEERGKARQGEKTILDAFIPAAEALENSLTQQYSLREAFKAAYEAARRGAEHTKALPSVHGRGAWYGQGTLGKQDPGATAGMLLWKAATDWISQK
jgi:dihydroxyacetone kinase-like protein